MKVSVVSKPLNHSANSHYLSNRAPLAPGWGEDEARKW